MPVFKGFPKDRKQRGLVPSHSWITAGASKVADYLNQLVLALYPWVVNSTIKVINMVRESKVNRNDEVWLVTGDVQSFYTNVPIKESDERDELRTLAGLLNHGMSYRSWKTTASHTEMNF